MWGKLCIQLPEAWDLLEDAGGWGLGHWQGAGVGVVQRVDPALPFCLTGPLMGGACLCWPCPGDQLSRPQQLQEGGGWWGTGGAVFRGYLGQLS